MVLFILAVIDLWVFFRNDNGSKSLRCENDPCGFVWNLGCLLYTPTCQLHRGKTSSTMFFLGRRLPNICREPHVVSPNGKPSIRDSLSQWMGTSSPETRASWKGEAVQQLKLVNLTLQWFYGRFFRYINHFMALAKIFTWFTSLFGHHQACEFCQDLGIQARRRLRWWLCTLPETKGIFVESTARGPVTKMDDVFWMTVGF
jgi:hypothetical protein